MDALSRRLLFRIGAVGFSLGLNDLIEIREQVTSQIDFAQAEPQLFVSGALHFRQGMIPVVDLAGRLGLEPMQSDTALVLSHPEGNWALLVDRVEGFFPQAAIKDRPVPRLLQAEGWSCFKEIALYEGQPFLRLDLMACYTRARK